MPHTQTKVFKSLYYATRSGKSNICIVIQLGGKALLLYHLICAINKKRTCGRHSQVVCPHYPHSQYSTNDYLRWAAADIIALLNTKSRHPALPYEPPTEQIVRQAAEILQCAAPTPTPIALPPHQPTLPFARAEATAPIAVPSVIMQRIRIVGSKVHMQ